MTRPATKRAAEPWPGDANPEGPWDAASVLRWLASDGVAATAISIDLLPAKGAEPREWERYMANVYRIMHAHDLFLALSALVELDPAKADETANRIVLAAVCGDSYGEWLWDWAVDHGLDAAAISTQEREAEATR